MSSARQSSRDEATTSPTLDERARRALRAAAVHATRAPSVHNTQPWRFVVGGDSLEVHADWDRQLHVLDPLGRQLLISCGCALFNARVSLAAQGWGVRIDRLPDLARPDLLARLVIERGPHGDCDETLVALGPAIDVRRTNRREFTADPIPNEIVDLLCAAALAEGAAVRQIDEPEDRSAVALLNREAEESERANPAYLAELRAWTSDNVAREDGVLSVTVPRAGADLRAGLAVRDFDTSGNAALADHTRDANDQCLLLLGADRDTPSQWLRVGEALERVWLEIARRGFATSPFTQVIEVPRTNALLKEKLNLTMYPHVLIRVGSAPETSATRRRRLVDVLTVSVEQ